jgi:hypothetical protein
MDNSCRDRINLETEDDRHHNINVFTRESVAVQDFDAWLMGFHGINAEDAKTLPGYAPFFEHGFDAAKIGVKPGLALEMLKLFAAKNS